jgi:hypothetical protein
VCQIEKCANFAHANVAVSYGLVRFIALLYLRVEFGVSVNIQPLCTFLEGRLHLYPFQFETPFSTEAKNGCDKPQQTVTYAK